MADVTRAAAPINNRNIIQPSRENRNTNEIPFDFQDTGKVKQATPNSDMQSQANVLRQDGSTTGFYEVLHDQDVTSAFLTNIFLLKEIVDILPMNNETQTQEMQQLLNNLTLKPEEIVGEMMRQEDMTTMFKGGMFDMLRGLIETNAKQNEGDPQALREFQGTVSNFLKALNNSVSKGNVFDSVMNNMSFIRELVDASPKLSTALDGLLQKFSLFNEETNNLQNTQGFEELFMQLKSEALETFAGLEKSILYNDSIAKSVSMATYNLSRIALSDEGISESFQKLLGLMDNEEQKESLTNLLLGFLEQNDHVSQSKTMNALTEILKKQSENPELKMLNSDSMNKIIQSLLSSPCNFTPLLHYVIPVEYEDMNASAEMWINPDGENDLPGGGDGKQMTHMLIVFEIGDIGKFETELWVTDNDLTLSILCPEQYTDFYRDKIKDLRNDLSFSSYKIKSIDVETLGEPRSLIDVFKSLPERRTGINVSI